MEPVVSYRSCCRKTKSTRRKRISSTSLAPPGEGPGRPLPSLGLTSPAMALASMVLPVPGGPTSSTPLGSLPPSRVKRCIPKIRPQ